VIPERWYVADFYNDVDSFFCKLKNPVGVKCVVHISGNAKSPLNQFVKKCFKNANLVITSYPKVDIKKLPFKSSSVDIIMNEWVLEHVPKVWLAPREIYRVLRKGGICVTAVPFIFGIHGDDYLRFTPKGLRDLFSDFKTCLLSSSGHPEISNFILERRNYSEKKYQEEEKRLFSKFKNRNLRNNHAANAVWGIFRK